jgi:hypothetical protein
MTDPKDFNNLLNEECLLQRRRGSLFDIEEGPTLEQISNETSIPLHILQPLNPLSSHHPASLTRDRSPTFTPHVVTQGQSVPNRNPRYVPMYTHIQYVNSSCEEVVTWKPETDLPQPRNPRRSPRQATHYVREGYVCYCPHAQRGGSSVNNASHSSAELSESPVQAALRPIADNVESPLFIAEDKPTEITWKKQSRRGRWSPYPTPR